MSVAPWDAGDGCVAGNGRDEERVPEAERGSGGLCAQPIDWTTLARAG